MEFKANQKILKLNRSLKLIHYIYLKFWRILRLEILTCWWTWFFGRALDKCSRSAFDPGAVTGSHRWSWMLVSRMSLKMFLPYIHLLRDCHNQDSEFRPHCLHSSCHDSAKKCKQTFKILNSEKWNVTAHIRRGSNFHFLTDSY